MGTKERSWLNSITDWLLKPPYKWKGLFQGKMEAVASAIKAAPTTTALSPSPEGLSQLTAILMHQLRLKKSFQGQSTSKVGTRKQSLHHHEYDLVEEIRETTVRHNRNNVTRTKAYLQIYRQFPELHWAFLAHMVSRNSGYNMTDLRGDLLPHLLNEKQSKDMFSFLERANWLIFQDAYPQLLLYAYSRKQNRSLFHLLPVFSVSGFMHPVWNLFWQKRDSVLLSQCLIINEQNYIESRIVRNTFYREHVLDTLLFQTQALFQLNQIIFPYRAVNEQGIPLSAGMTNKPVSHLLAGLILEDFSDLTERIEFGKKLYGILFGIPEVFEGATSFAYRFPHTGSRLDYCPQLFSCVNKASPGTPFRERLDQCRLKPESEPFYSPMLEHVWQDQKSEAAGEGDWFQHSDILNRLGTIKPPLFFDMTAEACLRLKKIELAILAAQHFSS
ncbi:DUF2515 family protein [Paenibacillus larvae]|uniref:DUF2515 domain-containing protein n=4 Tax=Paenibacillus larvae TaxID=1464 RepID=V9WAQ0_9BACL|nr:DUF2515 family protein [Paenibacillus larvae]AHD06765.1 hypothetical protein ERIC2_c29830 [Paenibacillus larvae subsp. larvae DSM 25430]AVF21080.1 hypothetical protein ERICI_01179 [Paenibacillus larvae subsp. larvae]AVG13323.1 hypothetical protein ERICII_02981 [Paenibacillus larvae subsp. larvae DSM 25430]ETK27859.1 hypothetical protein ERIC1_1c13120 [Paenibacillus larvae subsp. larvae DSM 25719]MCY7490238.1 DUF2515 domain-containing protein [Paenibacillus larvae]